MEHGILRGQQLAAFEAFLLREERAPGTVEKYLRDTRAFAAWLGGGAVTKERAAE